MGTRDLLSRDRSVINFRRREIGELCARKFFLRVAASEDLVLRLDMYNKLEKHKGCVNTISFNATGETLVSGSDDRWVMMWDWQTGRVKHAFPSGHVDNVFQAKIMPFTDDRIIVSCAADGQVRYAQILERGTVESRLVAKHERRAHKLAIEPGSPYIFYSCGEDGLVQHYDLRTRTATKLFICQSIIHEQRARSVIRLNAITIDPRNPNFFAVAGSDEYTRLFDVRKLKTDGTTEFGKPANFFCPAHLIGETIVGITGLSFSAQSELLVSYNDEFIYLFARNMGLGPDPASFASTLRDRDGNADEETTGSPASPSAMNVDEEHAPRVYKGHRNCDTVKGVSFCGPSCEYVVSGSDCGRIFIWNKKSGNLVRVMEADKHIVNCIEAHPSASVLASSGIENNIKIWIPKAVERALLPTNIEQLQKHHRSNDFFNYNIFYYFSNEEEEDANFEDFNTTHGSSGGDSNGDEYSGGSELYSDTDISLLDNNGGEDSNAGEDDDDDDGATLDDLFT